MLGGMLVPPMLKNCSLRRPRALRGTDLRANARVRSMGFARFSILSLAVGATLGCADLLGLDEMSFEKRLEEEEPPATEVPPEEDDQVVSLGGARSGPDPVAVDSDFPRIVPAGVQFVSSPRVESQSRYWIYDPGARTIESLVLVSDGPDSNGTQSWNSLAPFTHLTVAPLGELDAVFGYDQKSGALSLVSDVDGMGEPTLLTEDVGSVGRDVVLSFPLGESYLVLSATSQDGHYRYFNPDPETELDVVSGNWEAGFTSVVPFSYGGDEGVLRLDPMRGVLAFDRLAQYGQPLENVFETLAPGDAEILVSFFAEGSWRLALYEPTTGEIDVGDFSSAGEGAVYHSVETNSFREGLTSLTVVYSQGAPFAITFSPASAAAQIRSLWPLDDSSIVVK